MNTQIRTPNMNLWRNWRWIASILGVTLIAFVGCTLFRTDPVPANLDYSTTRTSSSGLYRLSYTPSIAPIPINQLHTWTLHLETAQGQPINDATILVNGDMPQHGHGLPTKPVVTDKLGNGNYLVEGMKFQMTGWWVMDFAVTANGKPDKIEFNLMLEGR
jgi:YtkA-like